MQCDFFPGKCSQADVIFLLDLYNDSSDSLDWSNMQELVQSYSNSVKLSPSGTQIGVVLFTNTTVLNIKLDQYQTSKDIATEMSEHDLMDVPSDIGAILRETRLNLFKKTNGGREVKGMRKMVVLLTKGRNIHGDSKQAKQEAAKLRKDGVQIYVVSQVDESGLGNETKTDLHQLGSRPSSQSVFLSEDLRIRTNHISRLIESRSVETCLQNSLEVKSKRNTNDTLSRSKRMADFSKLFLE